MEENRIPIAIGLAFNKAPPQSIDAGTEFSFSVSLSWPEGIGPECATFRVRDGDRTIHAGDLPKPAAEDGDVEFTLAAPEEVGEHLWTLVVACAGNEEGELAKGALPLIFTTVPHATSLAVWDNPSPVVRGARFEVKVGAKCTASCGLGGSTVEIRDEAGKLMGSGALDDATWVGTASLYWTTLQLKAPRKRGLHAWTVSFSPADLNLPHGGATSSFSFVTVAEPEHSVSVKVVNKKTKAPIGGAQVRLGLYRAVTDETGSAKVGVPKGEFELVVTRAGYKMPERSVEVSKDVRLRIVAETLPEEDPFASWTA
jgi:hypothetical protein